ncbi:MAG: HAD-IA family hydrolase [Parcubacteria group bacterium]|nr:HAD-IA family hydrolase [Parcubacteria group bacterium]
MIKHIICDVGGVILKADFDGAMDRMSKHSKFSKEEICEKMINSSLYDLFAEGKINKTEFYYQFSSHLKCFFRFEEFVEIWNSTIIDVNKPFFQFLKKLPHEYTFSILSDTDELHWPEIKKICHEPLKLFNNFFLSYEMNSKKPDPAIFFEVMLKLKALPKECLFIDDRKINIETAKWLKMNAALYDMKKHNECVEEIKSILK